MNKKSEDCPHRPASIFFFTNFHPSLQEFNALAFSEKFLVVKVPKYCIVEMESVQMCELKGL